MNSYSQSTNILEQNGNVGIGINPQHKLHIQGTHYNSQFLLHSLGGGTSERMADLFLWASEPGLTYSGTGIGNNVINVSTTPYLRRINNTRGGSYIRLLDGEIKMNIIKTDGHDINTISINNSGNVGIGTTTTGTHKLAVNGTIGAREIKVEATGWSDFVFEDDYELKDLVKVEAFIKENNHLPDVPSEKEVLENGIQLGEMDAKLLQKIEELTLYLIK